ncbi:MAG: PTS sugar transporter subunit IIA [Phycisphaerae bacterium]|nr:PTS sugar transporter subunit IIA [Phycisphaerae bacterium]
MIIQNEDPLFALSMLLLCGFALGEVAKKIKLPALAGNIAAGVVVGPYGLKLFTPDMIHGFGPITDFALCVFGLTMGTHLVLRQLHNSGKRLFYIVGLGIVIVPSLIFVVLFVLVGRPLPESILLAAIGLTTSPSSIIHLIVHRRSKGIFTKTLVSTVALNSIASLVLFSIAVKVTQTVVNQDSALTIMDFVMAPAKELLASCVIGMGAALILRFFARESASPAYHFSFLLILVLLVTGLCRSFQIPGILAGMVLGFLVANFSSRKHILLKSFAHIEPGIYCLFFVLAGTHINFQLMLAVGMGGTAYVIARAVGKYAATTLGAYLTHASPLIKKWMGISLFPQAGIAVGLVFVVESIPEFEPFAKTVTAIVLGSVVIYEVIGPILTDLGIRMSGEVNKNQARLLEFLQEEFILVGLDEKDKWRVLAELGAFMHRVHGVREIDLDDLIQSIVTREKQMSTGIGEGIAVPHARIEGGPEIRGVIGISRAGIEFDAADKNPVHVIVLIATPDAHYEQHLRVLAAIAKIFGQNPELMAKILRAKNAAEVHEILQSSDIDEVNVYLD